MNLADKVVCPTDPSKTCLVSESACANATCPLHPDAVCSVMPCSCLEVFMDNNGLPVECTIVPTTTLPPDATTPESDGGDEDDTEHGRGERLSHARALLCVCVCADSNLFLPALWQLAVMAMIMIVVGLLLLVSSAIARKLRGPRGRSWSTATLIRRDCSGLRRVTPIDNVENT